MKKTALITGVLSLLLSIASHQSSAQTITTLISPNHSVNFRIAKPHFFVELSPTGDLINYGIFSGGPVKYDLHGRLQRIGSVEIEYDLHNRISKIDSEAIAYHFVSGKIEQVGETKIEYTLRGYIDAIN